MTHVGQGHLICAVTLAVIEVTYLKENPNGF